MNASELSTSSGPDSGQPSSLTEIALVVEDDPVSRRLLESCLREWNYRVTALDNGLDAWSVLQQNDSPQMVILDWMMPGLDGIELCRRIRSHRLGTRCRPSGQR